MPQKDNVERFAFLYDFVVEPLDSGVRKASDTITNFVDITTKGLTSVIDLVTRTTVSLVSLGSRVVTGAIEKVLVPIRGMASALGMAAQSGKQVLGGLGKMTKGFGLWAKQSFQVGNRLSGIGTTLKFIGKIGGLAVLFGPLLLLIKPFMMLVKVITQTLQPALDVLQGALQAAFAPLAMELQKLAVKILPHLMKLIDPLVAFLVRGVEMLGKFFEEGHFDEIVGVFDELLPIIEDIVKSFVRDFLKPVGGALFRTVITMFKSLVKFAVEFVKTIAPFLPKFFTVLNKIAGVILGGLGEAFDVLLVEFAKILRSPDFIILLNSMVELLEALLLIAVQLIPPLTKLFAQVLGKFIVPGMVKLLAEITGLMIGLVEASRPAVAYIKDILDALNEWWDRNEDIFGMFWDTMRDNVKWISDQFTEFWGMMEKGAKAVLGFFEDIVDSIADIITDMGKMFDKAVQGAKDIPVIGSLLRAIGASEGEYVTRPSVRLVAEAGTPEWIVPDTPAGMRKYVPQMLTSAYGPEVIGVPELALPAAARPVEARIGTAAPGIMLAELQKEANRILKSIEQLLAEQGDEDMLPETLG